jgi:cobyric acid synthase
MSSRAMVIMARGMASQVGKSVLVAGRRRVLAPDGLRVAAFDGVMGARGRNLGTCTHGPFHNDTVRRGILRPGALAR